MGATIGNAFGGFSIGSMTLNEHITTITNAVEVAFVVVLAIKIRVVPRPSGEPS